MTSIPVSLAAEGPLDEVVLRTLLRQSGRPFETGVCYGKRGKDYTGQLTQFVIQAWRIDEETRRCSPSLDSGMRAVCEFEPFFPGLA